MAFSYLRVSTNFELKMDKHRIVSVWMLIEMALLMSGWVSSLTVEDRLCPLSWNKLTLVPQVCLVRLNGWTEIIAILRVTV